VTIRLSANGVIELAGNCPVEDAEFLLQQLLANPEASIDWQACESAHAAVLQVLLVAGAVPVGTPTGAFLRDHVAALLEARK
jgi:hypothetical protein